MSVHLHHTRRLVAWILAAIVVLPLPLALCFASLADPAVELVPVSGRVILEGRPIGGVILCLDKGVDHDAYGRTAEDGTFHLGTTRYYEGGAAPGRYRAHLYRPPGGPELPAKYVEASTAGIEIDIAPDWNVFRIELP